MRFCEIIGQEEVKNLLRQSVKDERIAHAQLFVGDRGVGKLQLALAYAQYIACPNRTDKDSCGSCPSCMQYQKLQHPDLHFTFPIVKDEKKDICDEFVQEFRDLLLKKTYISIEDWYNTMGIETKQGMIYEKESSEILRKLSLKSFSNGYKVMIIWHAEKMNVFCANKLLKMLEEPPTQTLFILISEHPEELLSTIISRTQEIRVPHITDEALSAKLHATINLSTEDTKRISRMANGSYLRALEFISTSEDNHKYFDDFVALMRNAWLVGQKKDYSALIQLRKWSIEIADKSVGKEKQKAFLQYAQRQIRENYIYNFGFSEMNFQTEAEQQFSTRFAPFIHDGNVEQMMKELGKAEMQITQNANARIVFFDLCLQMIILIKK